MTDPKPQVAGIRRDLLCALLAKVEEAKGPDRELDARLWAEVDGRDVVTRSSATWKDALFGVSRNHPSDETFLWQPPWPSGPRGGAAGHVLWYTGNVSNARALAAKALPDFWMSSGLCSLTGHASVGPDYNGPAGERLKAEWPEERFHDGFHADLKPGDGPHRECFAILSCMLQALIARETDQRNASDALIDWYCQDDRGDRSVSDCTPETLRP